LNRSKKLSLSVVLSLSVTICSLYVVVCGGPCTTGQSGGGEAGGRAAAAADATAVKVPTLQEGGGLRVGGGHMVRTASGRFSDGSDLLDGADRIGRAERPSSRAVTDVVTEQPSLGAAQVAPRRAVQARTAAARSARQGSHGGEPGRWRRDRRSGGLVDRLAGDPGFLGSRARRCASAQLWVLGTWRVPVQTRTCPCRAEVEIIGVFGGGWTLPDVRAVGTWTLPGSTVGLSFGWLPPCLGPAALAFLSPGWPTPCPFPALRLERWGVGDDTLVGLGLM
jgi:hypothetical protein